MPFDIVPQLIVNSLVASGFYALLAVGLALIYGTVNIHNFAHGSLALLGAYFYWTFHSALSWPAAAAIVASLSLLVAVGLVIEYLVFLRIKEASPLVSLVATIGLGIVIQNIILLFYGARTRSLSESVQTNLFFDGAVAVTNNQIVIISLSIVLLAALFLFLQKTKLGVAIRAVSQHRELAAIVGIDVKRMITAAVIISTVLAGIAGIMGGYDQNIVPTGALLLNIKAFSAVILGGLGSLRGALVGALIIGFAENILIAIPFGDFYIPSSFKDVLGFVILIIVLYIRPFGIFGMSAEEATKK